MGRSSSPATGLAGLIGGPPGRPTKLPEALSSPGEKAPGAPGFKPLLAARGADPPENTPGIGISTTPACGSAELDVVARSPSDVAVMPFVVA